MDVLEFTEQSWAGYKAVILEPFGMTKIVPLMMNRSGPFLHQPGTPRYSGMVLAGFYRP